MWNVAVNSNQERLISRLFVFDEPVILDIIVEIFFDFWSFILLGLCILIVDIFRRIKIKKASLSETISDLFILIDKKKVEKEYADKLIKLTNKAYGDENALRCCKKLRYHLKYGSKTNFIKYINKCYNEHSH